MQFKVFLSLLLNDKVLITPNNVLELSLDCHICQRTDRTIIFEKNKTPICRKTGHTIEGNAIFQQKTLTPATNHYNLSGDVQQAVLTYRVNFDYQPFIDQESKVPSSPTSKWGRMSFTLQCPVCNTKTKFSTQSNLKHPIEFHCKKCQHLLAIDTTEQPTYQYTN
jgi:hypothetical protein